jgi:purine-binding chemotaxis protein CheW
MNEPTSTVVDIDGSLPPSVVLQRGIALQQRAADARQGANTATQREWNALRCGDFELLLSRRLPCQIVALTAICPIPHAAPFLRGAVSVQGFVTPVFDLDLACGFAAIASARHLLVFGQDDERLALLTAQLPSRITAAALELLQTPPPLPALLRAALQTCFFADERYLLEIDAAVLFEHLASAAFASARHVAG